MKKFLKVWLVLVLIILTAAPSYTHAATSTNKIPKLQKISSSSGTQVLTEEGILISWGGFGSDEGSKTNYAQYVLQGISHIVDVSVVYGVAIVVTQDGTVWKGRGVGELTEYTKVYSGDKTHFSEDEKIVQVEATQNYIYALRKDGQVLAWKNSYSEPALPTLIPGLDQVKDIFGSYFIRQDGTVWHVMPGTSVARQYITITDVKKVDQYGSVFLKEDGTVWTKSGDSAVQIQQLPKIMDISNSSDASFALDESGNMYGWGDNRTGTLGDGTANQATVPKIILKNVRLVSEADGGHMVVQKEDLSVWAWGFNYRGGLGMELPNKKKNSPIPVKVPFQWPTLNVWDQSVRLNLNGKNLYFTSNKPYLTIKQEVMIPSLAFAKQAKWAASISNGKLNMNDSTHSLSVTKSSMVDGKGNVLSSNTSAQFRNGEVYVPLRVLSEAFNLTFNYYSFDRSYGIYTADFTQKDNLDDYGKLIRTKALPAKASKYPYVLAGIPNQYYEKEFPKANSLKGLSLNAAQLYRSKAVGLPIELTSDDFGRYANHISKYYELLLNTDYRTINMNWAPALESHAGGSTSKMGDKTARELQMEGYVKWIKNKKVIIQGDVRPEPSMVTYRNGVLYMRTYIQYEIVHANAPNDLKLRKDRVVQLISAPKDKKIVGSYAMYIDVPLTSDPVFSNGSAWGSWSSGLKVDTRYNDIIKTPWESVFTLTMSPD
ncbi:hypothetical protein MHI01_26255 [Paenibacillus sp. FSL M7-0656]|uniref:RCC1 domain-containing protein n=1 Tax=Paenibacillus sp. FSL M7-0656 TaxID=2921534 RepID=UPI0030F88B74